MGAAVTRRVNASMLRRIIFFTVGQSKYLDCAGILRPRVPYNFTRFIPRLNPPEVTSSYLLSHHPVAASLYLLPTTFRPPFYHALINFAFLLAHLTARGEATLRSSLFLSLSRISLYG